MPSSISIYALVPLLTLLQGFLFATLLILRGYREERYADYWLAFALILLSINGVPYMFGWLGIETLWEDYTYLPWDGFWLVIPPTIYFFLKSLTNDQWRFAWRRDVWHFTAYGIYFVEHLIVGLIGLNNKSFVTTWGEQPILIFINPLLSWGIEIYYFILSYRLYKDYKKWTLNEFSDPDSISFTWVRNYLVVKLCLTLISIANFLVVHLSLKKGNDLYALMWWGYLMDTLLIYYLSISGYAQSRVKTVRFTQETPAIVIETDNSTEHPIPITLSIESDTVTEKEGTKNKNTLTETDLEAWKTKVLTFFATQKPYLNPELTLSDLASNLKTNTSILSQVINSGFSKNFNDFVNQYRVEEFKQKAKSTDYQHLTLLAIAFECGFNSKATFNRAFKKMTGQNPSDLF
ncbi:MAG: helix-turn-helix transcriptional regulator [Saprospiraceae bacterium]|nr:helix-turn-helix transcriptional regulator [Saprospiraceae bacterium]